MSEITLKYGYKIHGIDTVEGRNKSAKTSKFYETYQDALRAARNCVVRSSCEIVIFRAFKVVGPVQPTIVEHNVRLGDDF